MTEREDNGGGGADNPGRPITVAELLARNKRASDKAAASEATYESGSGASDGTPRSRRHRSEEGGISVRELTGEIPRVPKGVSEQDEHYREDQQDVYQAASYEPAADGSHDQVSDDVTPDDSMTQLVPTYTDQAYEEELSRESHLDSEPSSEHYGDVAAERDRERHFDDDDSAPRKRGGLFARFGRKKGRDDRRPSSPSHDDGVGDDPRESFGEDFGGNRDDRADTYDADAEPGPLTAAQALRAGGGGIVDLTDPDANALSDVDGAHPYENDYLDDGESRTHGSYPFANRDEKPEHDWAHDPESDYETQPAMDADGELEAVHRERLEHDYAASHFPRLDDEPVSDDRGERSELWDAMVDPGALRSPSLATGEFVAPLHPNDVHDQYGRPVPINAPAFVGDEHLDGHESGYDRELGRDDYATDDGLVGDLDGGIDDERRRRTPRWLAIVLEAIVGLVVGAGLFFGFFQMWLHMQGNLKYYPAVLAVVVIVAIAGIAHTVRRTHDSFTILLAVLVGVVVTFGPLIYLIARS